MNVEMVQHPDAGVLHFSARHRVRLVLFAFILTFMCSRIVTFLIMARRIPDLYLHLGGTHVHHLNYGIFLLSGVGAYLICSHAMKNEEMGFLLKLIRRKR